jgi:hypothetical protein
MGANAVATALGAASSQCLGGAFDCDLEGSARPTELCSYPVEILSRRKELGSSREEEAGARLAPPSGHCPCPDGEQHLGIRRDVLLRLMHSTDRYQQMAIIRRLDIAVPSVDEVRFGPKRRDGSNALMLQHLQQNVCEHRKQRL